jgi:hypothetical protein
LSVKKSFSKKTFSHSIGEISSSDKADVCLDKNKKRATSHKLPTKTNFERIINIIQREINYQRAKTMANFFLCSYKASYKASSLH